MYNYPYLLSVFISIKEFLGLISLNHATEKEFKINIPKKVQNGPFKGMIYECKLFWGNIYPKLIGSYESELFGIINKLLRYNFDNVINVGCAEGYYAVGFALKSNVEKVIAVDPLKSSRKEVISLSEKNEVEDRIELKIWTSAKRLSDWVKERTLIIMDCEGSEVGYLKNHPSTNFHKAYILCEIHDFSAHPNIGIDLINRFEKTHKIKILKQQKRESKQYKIIESFDERMKAKLLDEQRPKNNYWIYFEPLLKSKFL